MAKKIAVLLDKQNSASLCGKPGNAYKRLIARDFEEVGEFDTPYWAHKWLKENGYEKIGAYIRDPGDKVETYHKKEEI